MADKIFCGSAKIVKTQYGEMTKISFTADDLNKMRDNLDKGWVNLVLKEKKTKVDGKPTHYLEIDEWKPTKSDEHGEVDNPSEDDLPF